MDLLIAGKTTEFYALYFHEDSKVNLEVAVTPSNFLFDSYTEYCQGITIGDPLLSDTEHHVKFTEESDNWDMSGSSSAEYVGTVTVKDNVATINFPDIILASDIWKRTR